MWPPGAGDQAGPDAGLVMSRCAIQTQALASPGTGTFYHESVTATSQAWLGEEKIWADWELDFVSKVLVLLWDDRVFVDELEWTKSIEKYFSQ